MDHLHQYKYRPTVYVLAIVDIILSSISLSWSFLFVITLCVAPDAFANNIATTIPNRHNNNNNRSPYKQDPEMESTEKPNVQNIVAIIWVAVVVQIMACVLQTMAAIKLLNASKPNANPVEALIQCRFWQRVTAFFTILLFAKLIFGSEGRSMLIYLFTMSNIILRLTCIRYVQLYIKELKGAPPFGGILPIHHIITHTAVHPNHPSHPHHPFHTGAYFPAPHEIPKPTPLQMDLPPSYEECLKQPVNKEPDLRQKI